MSYLIAVFGMILLITSAVGFYRVGEDMRGGYYFSKSFGYAMEELLNPTRNYIQENKLTYNEETKNYELSKKFLEENRSQFLAEVSVFTAEIKDKIRGLKAEDWEKLEEYEKEFYQEELEKFESQLKNAEEIVKANLIQETMQNLSGYESDMKGFSNVAIRIERDGKVIYEQGGKVPLAKDMDTQQARSEGAQYYWLGILDSSDRVIQKVGTPSSELYRQIDVDGDFYFMGRVGIENPNFWNSISNLFYHGVREDVSDFEVIFYIDRAPEDLQHEDRIQSGYRIYKQDLLQRQIGYGSQAVFGLVFLGIGLSLANRRRKDEKLLKIAEGHSAELSYEESGFEKIFNHLMDWIGRLKFEIKAIFWVLAFYSLDFMLGGGIKDDFAGVVYSIFFIMIGILFVIDFIGADKENYIKNSLWLERREQRRKRKLIGLAKGLDFTFDMILLIGALIIGALVFSMIMGQGPELYLITSLIGGTYILFLVWQLSTKLHDERIGYIDEISDAVEQMMSGDMLVSAPVREGNPFAELAQNINRMKQGYGTAMEEKIRSEKMKTELITNVSHDLKTPLTSIINYVDLLKKENIEPEYARDYVAILEQKSERLNVLIQDLFEVSKAASGDMALCLEKLDVTELLRQTLAEMDGKIKNSQLEFIVNIPNEPIYIIADGKKLHRVFDNLIINILKYSLQGTRVYIDFVRNGHVKLTMKNIANYEMNFTQEEITQRFTRADKARTSEGSGLGLAIAKSFVDLMNMDMRISTDGDLFKVELEMKIAQ